MENEDIRILSEEEINKKLNLIPGWEFKGSKLTKEFKFEDFLDSINFILLLSPVFEEKNHHPDIQIHYSRVLFELTTHDIGGKVTDLDFIIAQEIERLFNER
jgi:4a-hydroxytetrahydrobiopterin dehydratase